MKREKKIDNRGFSLVELIIVIAIMAVLIVALAPQYLKYVEKSRNSTDASNAAEMVAALQIYAADPDIFAEDAFKEGKFTITTSGTGTRIEVISGESQNKAAAIKAFEAAGFQTTADGMETACVSKTAWNTYTITVEVQSGGKISFTYGASGTENSAKAFSNLMTGKSGGNEDKTEQTEEQENG